MNLENFYQNVVLKTVKDLGDPIKNKVHMISGMTSEIADEFVRALANEDIINQQEEIGDNEWFTVGAMHYYGLTIPTETVDKSTEVLAYLTSKKLLEFDKLDISYEVDIYIAVMYIMHANGILNAILKKEVTSNVLMYEKQYVSNEQLYDLFTNILYCNSVIAKSLETTIEEIRERIAKKLNVRHNGAAMTTESDINRNTDEEMKAFQS
jgi:NTP pyrophosphatase (non-canonical NTP hydrolase)